MIMLCLYPAWHWQVWCGSHESNYAEHSDIDAAHAWNHTWNFELSHRDSHMQEACHTNTFGPIFVIDLIIYT